MLSHSPRLLSVLWSTYQCPSLPPSLPPSLCIYTSRYSTAKNNLSTEIASINTILNDKVKKAVQGMATPIKSIIDTLNKAITNINQAEFQALSSLMKTLPTQGCGNDSPTPCQGGDAAKQKKFRDDLKATINGTFMAYVELIRQIEWKIHLRRAGLTYMYPHPLTVLTINRTFPYLYPTHAPSLP